MNQHREPVDDALERLLAEFICEEEAGKTPRIDDYARRLADREQRRRLFELHDSLASVRSTFPQRIRSRTLLGGRYRLVELRGAGGFGKVWFARDERLDNRPVAVKLLEGLSLSNEQQAALARERKALSKLDHPYLVRILDVGTHEGAPYLVMERVPGRTLTETLDDRKGSVPPDEPLAWRTAVEWMLPWLSGLSAAHDAGLIHRDIKPANIMLRPDGKTVLLDFGIATTDIEHTMSGTLMGTIPYLPPERTTRQSSPAGITSDVYQAGLVLFELLCARPAFDKTGEVADLLLRIQDGNIPPLRQIRPDLPRDLERVCQRATATRTEHRHRSIAELREDLDDVLAGLPPRHVAGKGLQRVRSNLQRAWRRNRLLATATLATGLGALLGLVLWPSGPTLGAGEFAVRRDGSRYVVEVVGEGDGRLFGFVSRHSEFDQELARSPLLAEDGRSTSVPIVAGKQTVVMQLPDGTATTESWEARFCVRYGDEVVRQEDFHRTLLSWLQSRPTPVRDGVPIDAVQAIADEMPRGGTGWIERPQLLGDDWFRSR
ncbi:MAG: serine/threonine-protein kinase [Planctomycetota bacterium]